MFRFVRELFSLFIGLIEIVLSARFVLKLLGANAAAQVVDWVFATSEPLLRPFQFAFPTPAIRGGVVIEFTTLFALFGYAFLGYVVVELLDILSQFFASHKKIICGAGRE